MRYFVFLLGILVVIGCTGSPSGGPGGDLPNGNGGLPAIDSVQTFYVQEGDVCTNDEGKPLVLMFSTTWCPHCKWVGPTFEKVAYEYIAGGAVEAHHYKLDILDDSITPEVEGEIPGEYTEIFQQFNPRGSIPTFVFGCRYYRIGNGYEGQGGGLAWEEAEFRHVIDQLLQE